MKTVTITTGIVLVAIGAVGYLLPSDASSVSATPAAESATQLETGESAGPATKRSLTALIPAAVGALLLICGLVAAAKPTAAKHAMHVAVLFGLLGAIAATGRGVPSLIKLASGDPEANSRAVLFLVLMAIACWTFVVLAIRSFIQARRQRGAEAGGPSENR